MLNFCLHSLLRTYGWKFVWHVALPHPIKTARALLGRAEIEAGALGGKGCVVGVGFCLKPMTCPSGRANHDCICMERLAHVDGPPISTCCRACKIRELGIEALKAGTAFYIMTSATDILFDLFLPALNGKRFGSGIFVLCRFSFEPFAAGLKVSGIRGVMLPLEQGDCRDYETWLRADRGFKDEQTTVMEECRNRIAELLGNKAGEAAAPCKFKKQGHIFLPEH